MNTEPSKTDQDDRFAEMLARLPEGCRRLVDEHRQAFDTAPGSSHLHQAWPGGFRDHLNEVFLLADTLYQSLRQIRPLPFTLDSADLVLFIHDLEKPFKYTDTVLFADQPQLATSDPEAFKNRIVETYQIPLTSEESNAIKYIHGEGDDYSKTTRIMGRLAAFCHSCDLLSARLWFDQPEQRQRIQADGGG